VKVRPLKGFGAFDAVMQQGKRYTVGPIGLTVVVGEQNIEEGTVRIGVAIGKRLAPFSVARSRVRRLLRESIRAVVPNHQQAIITAGITSMVFLWRTPVQRPADLSMQDVQPAVNKAVTTALSRITGSKI
jgi:ribonuclease P protein component